MEAEEQGDSNRLVEVKIARSRRSGSTESSVRAIARAESKRGDEGWSLAHQKLEIAELNPQRASSSRDFPCLTLIKVNEAFSEVLYLGRLPFEIYSEPLFF
jgi:hypothetical protein